jgi:hypothetical protein
MEFGGIVSLRNLMNSSAAQPHQAIVEKLQLANTPAKKMMDNKKHISKGQKHDKEHKHDKNKDRESEESEEEGGGGSSSSGSEGESHSGSASDEEHISSSSENEHHDDSSRREKKQQHQHVRQVHPLDDKQWPEHPLQQNRDIHNTAGGYYPQTQPLALEHSNTEALNLPTEGQLITIFEKLRDFNIEKIFPRNLVSPYKRITTSSSSTKVKVTQDEGGASEEDETNVNDPINTQLEKNIRILFEIDDSKGFNLETIQTTLQHCVAQNTVQTQGKTNVADMNEKIKREFQSISDQIKVFYKHLLNAMKALIVYSSQNANMVTLELKIFERHAYQAWQEVLSYLKAIQTVIMFAIKKKYLDSKAFRDLDVNAMINYREKELTHISEEVAVRKTAILQAEGMIQERDNMIRRIQERYSNAVKSKGDMESSLFTLQSQKRLMDNPAEIAKYNIQLLTPDSDK